MTAEENKRMFALSCIVADLKAENMELAQRVHQLVDEYNEVVRQLDGKETHKDEDPARLLLVNMQKMRDHCDKLEKENRKLNDFAKAIHSFMKDKKIYMEKGTSCGYMQGSPAVYSSDCLECDSCLGVIVECGVICGQRLKEANVSFSDNVGEVRLAEASASLETDVCEERLAEASEVFPNDD